MTLQVNSGVGRLHQAVLHRPGLELKRLTPANHDEYLFDDVLWVKHARQEHDAFADTLRDLGVMVHLLDQLLLESLAVPEAKEFILSQTLDERTYGPLALESLYRVFDGTNDATLATHLIEPGDHEHQVKVTSNPPEAMRGAIADSLGVDSIRVLTPTQDFRSAEREQWDDGCNALAVSPRVEVATMQGNELGRGRGGPRCMSCPIERDGI